MADFKEDDEVMVYDKDGDRWVVAILIRKINPRTWEAELMTGGIGTFDLDDIKGIDE